MDVDADAMGTCRKALSEAWKDCDHLARFEAWAGLYYRRFRRLSPGKSDPCCDSNDAQNSAQCDAWHATGLAAHDAIMTVVGLTATVERLKCDRDDRAEELSDLRAQLARVTAELRAERERLAVVRIAASLIDDDDEDGAHRSITTILENHFPCVGDVVEALDSCRAALRAAGLMPEVPDVR